MADKPMPAPQRDPDEAGAEPTPDSASDGEAAPRKPFVMRFPRAPIPGTELAVRSPSFGQASDTAMDATNVEVDDREFTVRLVQRQLDQDLAIEEVHGWPDNQLLAAAEGYLSLVAREFDDDEADEESIDEDGKAPPSGQAVDAESAPLTFAGVRDSIRKQNERRTRRMKKLMTGIVGLADSNAKKIAELVRVDPGIFKAMDPLKGIDVSKLGASGVLKDLDAFKGVELAKLTGTSRIADSISTLMADTTAMEKLARPSFTLPELPLTRIEREPITYIAPIVRPEIRLLSEVGETLEKMHDDQLRTAEGQIKVMVEQTVLLKAQGEALTALLGAMTVLVNDTTRQKWPRRGVLATAVIAAIASVLAVAYSAGVLHPFGETPAAVSTPSPAPVVSPSAAPSPTLVPTPTVVPTPAASAAITPVPTTSAAP